tara:strand:+ start:426 stop:878 length:453 start_codon:yes stop_codon:yes gene_type:complete
MKKNTKKKSKEPYVPNEAELTLTRMAVVASAMAFGVEAEDILEKRRGNEKIAMARMTCYWLLRKMEMMSYVRIGAAIGGKDHGSAINGFRRIESEIGLNLKRGYASCIRDAIDYYKDFRRELKRKELARKRKEFSSKPEKVESSTLEVAQ